MFTAIFSNAQFKISDRICNWKHHWNSIGRSLFSWAWKREKKKKVDRKCISLLIVSNLLFNRINLSELVDKYKSKLKWGIKWKQAEISFSLKSEWKLSRKWTIERNAVYTGRYRKRKCIEIAWNTRINAPNSLLEFLGDISSDRLTIINFRSD